MVDLLTAKLDGTPGFRVTDPRSVVAAARQDTAAALDQGARARIARTLGASRYVSGEVVVVAERLQLSAALYDVSGGSAPSARASVSGDTSDVFELVDDLTGRLLAGLVAGRDTTITRLGAVTTHSLLALKAFLIGEQALRAGRDAQAAAAFKEAITLDAGFALAHYRLAHASTWVSVPGVEIPALEAERAAALAADRRLSPLVRDLLAAYNAYKGVRAAEAERRYLALTRAHPDNVESWFMLAETLFHYGVWHGRSPAESRHAFERVLALDPWNSHAIIHLARLAALEGRTAELDSLARRYESRYRDAERNLEIAALQAFVHNDSSRWARIGTSFRGDGVVATSVLQAAISYAQNLEAANAIAPALVQAAMDPIPTTGCSSRAPSWPPSLCFGFRHPASLLSGTPWPLGGRTQE
jgi:tetratricopeptide (TPR) repeat protein